ncbi:hypothetical protein J3L16_11835 [Alteromonas sp. 5E99-2]|uniref:hypothetical protein n=1 Tax=Alteromonas sp. 5E99-2 TaxID=2817683 RepID=UPI001A99B154|nr:hypothetical protein [Alteromonas sp. 5E99-2]MBO1256373.1 hypothetical protein [Alteromonas sp. 5E99-2]
MNLQDEYCDGSGQLTGQVTEELLRESFCIAQKYGAKAIVSVSSVGIERLLRSMGIQSNRLGTPMRLNGYVLVACYVDLNVLGVVLPLHPIFYCSYMNY